MTQIKRRKSHFTVCICGTQKGMYIPKTGKTRMYVILNYEEVGRSLGLPGEGMQFTGDEKELNVWSISVC